MIDVRSLLNRAALRGAPARSQNRASTPGPARSAADPAASSGQDARGPAQDGYEPHPKAPLAHTVAPHLEAIRAIQNQPLVPKVLGLSVTWKNQEHFGPELLRPHALHTLGFADSAKRSEHIVRGLKLLSLFDDKGALQFRVRGLDREMEYLRSISVGGKVGLTAKEEAGVRIYLLGLEENLQILGQDITKLPAKQRRDWLFYAGFQESLEGSRYLANKLKKAGVLDKNYLPKNGGKKFDKLLARELKKYPDYFRHEMQNIFSNLRDHLFPLPLYTDER